MHRKPKYQQVAEKLLKNWQENPASFDYTQQELAKQYGVHVLTLRHALQWLQTQEKLTPDRSFSNPKNLLSKKQPTSSAKRKPSFLIGFPLWIRSLTELDVTHMSARLDLARKIHQELLLKGYSLDIQCVGNSHTPNLPLIHKLCEQWDGIILEPMESESTLSPDHPLIKMKDRMFTIGHLQSVQYNSISYDLYTGGQIALHHLVQAGCRNILYTGRNDEDSSHQFLRLAAAETAVAQYPGVKLHCAEGGFFSEQVFSGVKRFFLEQGKCDGILAASGYAYSGAMHALIDLGLRCPQDVQIVSLGRPALATYLVPRPTYLTSEPGHMTRTITQMLLERIRTPGKNLASMLIPLKLVQGDTTSLAYSPASSHEHATPVCAPYTIPHVTPH